MDSVVVNGREIMLPANVKNAIIDTGTTLVGEWKTGCSLPNDEVLIIGCGEGGPKEVLDVLFASINGSMDAGVVDPLYDGYYLIREYLLS